MEGDILAPGVAQGYTNGTGKKGPKPQKPSDKGGKKK